MQKPLVATISKFPPYMSGHSFEAMNQGRALYEITGYKHHEVTYSPEVYDRSANFNDSPSLLKKIPNYLYVHRVRASISARGKIMDGELIKAMTGKLINLISSKNVNVISTFYIDPHAFIANQAKNYAEKVLGKKVLVVQKAVGSDVLSSIGNHLRDGQGRFLLLQLLEGDLVFAVSQYTKDKLVEYARVILPYEMGLKIASRVEVLYAPFDNEYFSIRDEKVIRDLKLRFKIKPGSRVISYFGRLFPEKGVEDLIRAFASLNSYFSDLNLVIGGQGVEMGRLRLMIKDLGLKNVRLAGGVSDLEKRGIMQMSDLGVIPTKPVSNFVETLCISALEYQASGCVLLTTKVGGVPEAAGSHSLYAKHSNPEDLARNMAKILNRQVDVSGIRARGLRHVLEFNYLKVTRRFLEKVMQKRETKVRGRGTINTSAFLIPELPLHLYGRRYKI